MKPTDLTPRIRLLILGPRLAGVGALDQLLALQQAIVVVGEAIEICECSDLVRRHKPDVILLHALGADFALHATRNILSQAKGAKLLLITQPASADIAVRMLEHGARGLLPPSDVHSQGQRSIHAVHAGEIWASRALLSRIVRETIRKTALVQAQENSLLTLTQRENEIMELLRLGSSNKEIAAQLCISDKTVKTHLQNIFGKMNIRRRQHVHAAVRSS